MGKIVTVDIQAKTDKAISEIQDLKAQLAELQKTVADGNKSTEKSFKSVEKSASSVAKGIRGIGNAIKKAGLGLLIVAFTQLKEVFTSNQKTLDFFNTSLEFLQLAFNDLYNFLDSNIGSITGWFKDMFDNPKKSVEDLAKSIQESLIKRFNFLIDSLGHLGKAFDRFFRGDFIGAFEEMKSAGSSAIDVFTGVENSVDKIGEVVSNVANAASKYAKATWDSAAANTELNKQAEIARVLQQGLVESYDRQAEKLRQIRDEERNTIEERIAANDRLKQVLDEQEAAMLKQVDTQIASAQAQYDKNKNQENYIALLEATQEREAVLAQIEGFRSEQLMNDLALFRELRDVKQSIADGDFERLQAENQAQADLIGNEVARLQFIKQASQEEAAIRMQTLKDNVARTKFGTQAQIDATNELFNFQQENANNQKKLDQELAEAKLATISGALGGISKLVGENSKFGKAIAISQAIMDTYAGANKALAQGGLFGAIGAAGIIASGLANVKQIASTQEPSAPSFASGATTGATPSIPTPPDFNVVGASGANQLADAVAGQLNKPVKAYVVSKDVSTAQEMDRNVVDGASLG